ncbi:MAG: hypothetical protein HZA88_04235 [Verrucomicrobia bacterium]|nr:hypothetical protein [Verrucomicrobiota bacterium]
MKSILILEDNDGRTAAFQKSVVTHGDDFEMKVWRNAPSMMAESDRDTRGVMEGNV